MSNLQRMTSACYGIECFLRSHQLKTTRKFVADITADFLKCKGIKHKRFNPRYKGLFTAGVCNAQDVQEHFDEFREFVLEKYVTPPTTEEE